MNAEPATVKTDKPHPGRLWALRVLFVLLATLLLAVSLLGCGCSNEAGASDPELSDPAAFDPDSSDTQAPDPTPPNPATPNPTPPDPATPDPTVPETPGGVVKEGALAPDFSYTTVDGQSGSLSELKGTPVLLNFWASWCGPCVGEMPDIAALKADYPALEVLAVAVSDAPADSRDFISESGYDFRWVLDEQGTIGALYPTDGIPYTIIIDANGVIGAIFLGSPPDAYATYERALKEAGL
ncbi:MAG: TlpA family protein disulfide reductase [Coriobacteriales bacterium]|jgi:thiol-disulfide isomerase/thioredoxin|nr:TlpA family protein disulfide reductase [Coriobacteriales bacterium]